MTYKLQIVKFEEYRDGDFPLMSGMNKGYDKCILSAQISPDGAIELMQHLLELKERESNTIK